MLFSSKLRFSFSLLLMTFKHKIPWNTRNKFVERIYQYGFFLDLYRFCLLWSCSPPRSSNISLLGSLLPRSLNIKNVVFCTEVLLKESNFKIFYKNYLAAALSESYRWLTDSWIDLSKKKLYFMNLFLWNSIFRQKMAF